MRQTEPAGHEGGFPLDSETRSCRLQSTHNAQRRPTDGFRGFRAVLPKGDSGGEQRCRNATHRLPKAALFRRGGLRRKKGTRIALCSLGRLPPSLFLGADNPEAGPSGAAVIETMFHRRETPPQAPPPHARDDAKRGGTAVSRGDEIAVRQTRRTVALLCLTGLLWGWLLTWYPASADRPGAESTTALRHDAVRDDPPWRRTKDGWEPAWWLIRPKTFHRPALHPLWLFAGQMLSCAAVALTEDRKPHRTETRTRPLRRSR